MDTTELVTHLGCLPRLAVLATAGALHVAIVPLREALALAPAHVLQVKACLSPTGDPALALEIACDGETRSMVLAADDVVFAPASEGRAQADADGATASAPELVVYSEMLRDVRHLYRSFPNGALHHGDLARIMATFARHRAGIEGAIRIGLHPYEAVSLWSKARARMGAAFGLDTRVGRDSAAWSSFIDLDTEPANDRAGGAASNLASKQATISDFTELHHLLRLAHLDERVVALWNAHVALPPKAFREQLTAGLPPTTIEGGLDADGAGFELYVEGEAAYAAFRVAFGDHLVMLDALRVGDAKRHDALVSRVLHNVAALCERRGLTLHVPAPAVEGTHRRRGSEYARTAARGRVRVE